MFFGKYIGQLSQKINSRISEKYIEIVLCIYTIEMGCTFPFVKYIIFERDPITFPSFVLEIPIDLDLDLYLKNECFRRIFSFLQNIHNIDLNFNEMFKGFLKGVNKVMAFFDATACEFKSNVKFCIIDEILHSYNSIVYDVFSRHSFLQNVIVSGKKVERPRLYYPHYSNIAKRHEHPFYGDFFYFSRKNNKGKPYAVFDFFDNNRLLLCEEKKDPISSQMFSFEENESSILCVKHLLHFIIL